ncbi:hydrolase [Hyaloraphidium curvatum]|nr:hydrolase [Hyaloraphidium curvatum]
MAEVAFKRLSFRGDGGVTLVADSYGDPTAKLKCLFLHGGGQTRHSWGGTARELAGKGWYTVSADLRGHGESEWSTTGDYSMDAFQEDVLILLRALGGAVVVGASMGGTSAMCAAPSAGPLMKALILVDISIHNEPKGIDRIVTFMTGKREFDTLEEVADRIASYLPHRPRPKDLNGLTKNLRKLPNGKWAWHWDPNFMTRDRGPRRRRDEDSTDVGDRVSYLEERARQITCPVLLVRGKLSDVVSEKSAEEFRRIVPQAGFVDVAGASHMVAGDANDAFTNVILNWLDTLPTAKL